MRTDDFVNEMGEAEVANSETGLSFELKNLIAINKASIKAKVEDVVNGIQDGWIDPVDALILSKKGNEFFTLMEKNVRPMAEAKPVGKGFRKFDCEITEGMTGVRIDYSNCGDPVYNELAEKIDELTAELKERKKFLDGISKPTDIVINGAEVYKINPPIKSGKMGFKLEIK